MLKTIEGYFSFFNFQNGCFLNLPPRENKLTWQAMENRRHEKKQMHIFFPIEQWGDFPTSYVRFSGRGVSYCNLCPFHVSM